MSHKLDASGAMSILSLSQFPIFPPNPPLNVRRFDSTSYVVTEHVLCAPYSVLPYLWRHTVFPTLSTQTPLCGDASISVKQGLLAEPPLSLPLRGWSCETEVFPPQ